MAMGANYNCKIWHFNFTSFIIFFQAEQSYKKNPKMLNQLQYCEEEAIPYALVIGESEIEQGVVKLRTIATREEVELPRDQLIDKLRAILNSS